MRITAPIKTLATISAFTLLPLQMVNAQLNNALNNDVFTSQVDTVSVKGCKSPKILNEAPSPDTYIEGKLQKACIVIDLNKNYLYKYDSEGKATDVYLVASGKKSTPTDTGVRVVSHVENYPYRTAPYKSKRRHNPNAYGPKIIILNKLNTTNGVQSACGEFIHGNNDSSSLGKYASQGCIRMDNDVIKILSKQVKRGDIVKIIK